MFITEKEVRRIVSIHFKEKYERDVDPDKMGWGMETDIDTDFCVTGLEIGGDIIGKDD